MITRPIRFKSFDREIQKKNFEEYTAWYYRGLEVKKVWKEFDLITVNNYDCDGYILSTYTLSSSSLSRTWCEYDIHGFKEFKAGFSKKGLHDLYIMREEEI